MSKLPTAMSEVIRFLLEIVSERAAHSIPVNTVKAIIHLGHEKKTWGVFPKEEY
ncbi:hypothetical protein [Nitrosomonas communis]|uniref:hypothetical protein n=1 Tax=Nitrosomonas communis TaxID=44574 RepID=UPI0015A5B0C1|nr:hypothetical protein [Nitrosomonas communis]